MDKIAFRGWWWADMICFVRHSDVVGGLVTLGEDGYRCYPHIPAGAHYAHRDFAAISYEDFVDSTAHHTLTVGQDPCDPASGNATLMAGAQGTCPTLHLQRYIPMLLRWVRVLLGLQHLKGADEAGTGGFRLDDVINVATGGC